MCRYCTHRFASAFRLLQRRMRKFGLTIRCGLSRCLGLREGSVWIVATAVSKTTDCQRKREGATAISSYITIACRNCFV
ncbi:uncharacterized protein K489DRAFT_249179 [Dissoconium aciculare CBS 342.82]|uniref:Uncharacterized protein n=1 Tax=Dissoconium aciculare CBS 342.82 TaxID=1314786 RepID=A0A6J3M0E6_9PEZI|nr:uncharacterized protein K489DRAFT_249179 [Dissoconium aciculare CBS 342.82]KAF1821496.1 hypothetical protein K489DRAFT_249179 [Dissoconium aciculare CBS 342.82]